MRRLSLLAVMWLFACDQATPPKSVSPAPAPPPAASSSFDELITAFAQHGTEPRSGLGQALEPFRNGDSTVLISSWEHLVQPSVPVARAAQVIGYLSQLDPARVVTFVAERIEDVERRYEGRPADRLALLEAVNEWTQTGPAPAVPARHVLALHRARAIEELWSERTAASAVTFVQKAMVQFMRFPSAPTAADPVGRSELADLLIRHADVLAPLVSQEIVAKPTGEVALEQSLLNALVQCTGTDRLAQLDRAYGAMLAQGTTLRLDAAPDTLEGVGSALRQGSASHSVLTRLSKDAAVSESAASQEAFLRALSEPELAEVARTVLQGELDSVKAERATVRCLAGKVLGTLGAESPELAPRVAYTERQFPQFFSQRRELLPSVQQFAHDRHSLRRTQGVLLEVQLAPCRGKALPNAEGARRVLVASAEPVAYGKSVELAVVPLGPVTRRNADGQQETWEQFSVKDLGQLSAMERDLTRDVGLAQAVRVKGEAAARNALPRVRTAFDALRARR